MEVWRFFPTGWSVKPEQSFLFTWFKHHSYMILVQRRINSNKQQKMWLIARQAAIIGKAALKCTETHPHIWYVRTSRKIDQEPVLSRRYKSTTKVLVSFRSVSQSGPREPTARSKNIDCLAGSQERAKMWSICGFPSYITKTGPLTVQTGLVD